MKIIYCVTSLGWGYVGGSYVWDPDCISRNLNLLYGAYLAGGCGRKLLLLPTCSISFRVMERVFGCVMFRADRLIFIPFHLTHQGDLRTVSGTTTFQVAHGGNHRSYLSALFLPFPTSLSVPLQCTLNLEFSHFSLYLLLYFGPGYHRITSPQTIVSSV